MIQRPAQIDDRQLERIEDRMYSVVNKVLERAGSPRSQGPEYAACPVSAACPQCLLPAQCLMPHFIITTTTTIVLLLQA
jgi:hypothetical protein